MADKESQAVKIALIQKDVGYMKDKFDEVKEQLNGMDTRLSSHYITKEEFEPVKKIVYGLVGVILLAVVGAVVSLVLTNGAKP